MIDVVYRCACSWIGADPDLRRGKAPTCPACLFHDRKRVAVSFACPKCQSTSHRCDTGTCHHCDNEACQYAWWPLRKTSKPETTEKRAPDLFRVPSKVSVVLRWMIEQGEVSAKEFKAAHVALGGTKHSTHAFDRYFVGMTGGRFNTYVPHSGSHGILTRIGKGKDARVRWVGSDGDTFEARAIGWLANLAPHEINRAAAVCEAEMLADPANEASAMWFRLASGANVSDRSPSRRLPCSAATEVSTSAP